MSDAQIQARLHELSQRLMVTEAEVERLRHNNTVLTDALWKACGDDEQVVRDTIASQRVLR
jgi:hypothetical protein